STIGDPIFFRLSPTKPKAGSSTGRWTEPGFQGPAAWTGLARSEPLRAALLSSFLINLGRKAQIERAQFRKVRPVSSRRSAANCGIWAFASSRRDRAIMRKTRKPRRLLKKLSRPRGGDSRKRGSWQADRDLVSRRSPDRAEKQGHPPMGETRDTAFGAARPEDEFGLYFRRHLPGRRKRRRARTTLLQQ